MTERVEQWICIFCIKLKHSSVETIWMSKKATAMGNWWLATSSWQCTCSCITSHAEFFGETSNHPGDSAPLQVGCPVTSGFSSKLKSSLKRKRFHTINEIQEKMVGQLVTIVRTVWGSKVPTLKGTEASLAYLQFLVPCIFFNKCLYFMWGELIKERSLYSKAT